MGTTINATTPGAVQININGQGGQGTPPQPDPACNHNPPAATQTPPQGQVGGANQVAPQANPLPALQAPPAGQGLQTSPQGWPTGSVATAGGYHLVATGNTGWNIYEPGQTFGGQAGSCISGDPHVADFGGVHWDYSKSSDFVLG